jgi:hypothetical protein
MDTAPDCSGTNVKPIVHKNYDGTPITLPDDTTQIITTEKHPYLKAKIGDDKVPVKYFTIIHEIGHMFDHLKKISDTKKWINLSDWEEVDIDRPTPKGYKRYIEKRKGRDIPGHKKSGWVHDENAEFVRNYASKNPKEDFADTFAFVVLGKEFNFKGNGNKKIEIIKDYLR